MAKFKVKTVSKKQDLPPKPGLAFLFYNYSEKNLELLKDSINRMHKDTAERIRIYVLGEQTETTTQEDEKNIRFLPVNEQLLPDLDEYTDFVVLMPMDGLKSVINFNDFIKDFDFKQSSEFNFSHLLFQGQSPSGTGSFVTGAKLYESLTGIKGKRNKSLENDLNWYLERISQKPGRMIIHVDNPLFPPVPFYKKLKFSLQPVSRWIDWNLGVLYKKEQHLGDNEPTLRFIFTLLSFAILIILPIISFNAGISGDEEKHNLHAEKVYNYFRTDGADTLALSDPKYKLNYYSQSFDLIAYVIAEKLNIERIFELRHVMNGFIGALAIITTAVLVRFLAGNFAGILVILFLFFSPRFLGHAMNNPLDIPFAFGYIFTIYHIFRFLRKLPAFSLRHSFWIFFGITFTMSIRVGGMVLIPYFLMLAGLYVILNRWPWKFLSAPYLKFAGKGLIFLVIISIAGYFASLLPWPYALQAPLKNPFEALNMMANITVALRVMFEGNIIWSDSLPWYYIPKNMIISIPVIILIPFIIPVFMLLSKKQNRTWFWIFMLYFATIFPVAYIIYKESNVYGGWRHLLFVYPSFVALSVLGLTWIHDSFNKKTLRMAAAFLFIIGLTLPALHIFRNYPLQYIYFNKLVGGVNKAYKKYETDYYLNSLKPGTNWILHNLKPEKSDTVLRIISTAPAEIMKYYYRNADWISYPYTRYYDRGSYDWDYAIFYCNYIDPYQIRKNIWPPKNTIHEVKVDNVTVCAIVKRENRDDYNGITLMQEGLQLRDIVKVQTGLSMLENAIKYDPHNEIAYLSLARGYIAIQQFELARQRMNTLLSFYPNYDKAVNLIGYAYLNEGEATGNISLIDRSISYFNEAIKINYKYVLGYHNLGLAYMMKGDDNAALTYFNKAIELNARHIQSYYMMASIFEKRGESDKARQIIDYARSL